MKKLLATLLASAMALTAVAGLTACGGDKDSKTLTVWAPEASHAVYKELVKEWKAENEGWEVNFVAKAEGEAETDFGQDPAKGADVFFFESGQIATMKQKLYLQTLDAETTAKIKARDGANANGVIDDEGYAWAFPATADNGYFLWYDKTFFSADDVKSLDTMVEKVKEANKTLGEDDKKGIVIKEDDGWYVSSWFIGTGCEMDYVEGTNDYYTDVKSEKGQTAGKAAMKYWGMPEIISGDDGVVTTGFKTGNVVAAVRGTWIKKALVDNFGNVDADGKLDDEENTKQYEAKYGAAKLPTFTVDGDTTEYQMGSFSGGKFCGVNRYKNDAKSIEKSISLANFLTSEKAQLERFKATGAIPSNAKLAESDVVKSDMLARAFAEQMSVKSYNQRSQDGLWEAMATFGKDCKAGSVTTDNLSAKLDDLAKGMANVSKGGTLVEHK